MNALPPVGAASPRPSAVPAALPRGVRLRLWLRDAIAAYLPLLLMALLALFTWWLVRNTPDAAEPRAVTPARRDPDYTMSGFALERFDATGRLALRIEGSEMRHFPDTDRIVVDTVRIRAVAPDGRLTLASARQAVANGDASEVQLMGDARVDSSGNGGSGSAGGGRGGGTIEMRSEFLHAWLVSERVRSHLPVQVKTDGAQISAAGLDYDNGTRRLDLVGPTRTVLPPRGAAGRQP